MIPCIIVVTLAIVLFILVLEYITLPFFTRLVIILPSHIPAVSRSFCFVKNAFTDIILHHLRKRNKSGPDGRGYITVSAHICTFIRQMCIAARRGESKQN